MALNLEISSSHTKKTTTLKKPHLSQSNGLVLNVSGKKNTNHVEDEVFSG